MANFFTNLFKKEPKIITGIEKEEIKRAIDAISFPQFHFDTDDGRKIVALKICSKIISQDIGRVPLKLYKKDESGNKVIMRDDPRYTLLHDRPNKYTDIYSYKSAVEVVRSEEGNSYVEIIRDKSKSPVAFKLLEFGTVSGPTLVNDDLIYTIKDGDKERKLGSADILHFRNLSVNGYKGRDPKEDLAMPLSIAYKALVTLDNFYQNGAILTKVLESTVPEGLDPDRWKEQVEDFVKGYTSYANAHNTPALPPFTKLVDVATKPADADYISTIKQMFAQVAAYYGIPQHKIANIESSKFNALSDIQADYIENTLSSIMEMYRREYELKLLTDEEIKDGYSIEFETNALYITDSRTRWENYKNAFGIAAITPNKVAQLENLPTFDGGDDHYLMSNYQSVEAYNKKIKSSPQNIEQSGTVQE